jgi:hypothetical protein
MATLSEPINPHALIASLVDAYVPCCAWVDAFLHTIRQSGGDAYQILTASEIIDHLSGIYREKSTQHDDPDFWRRQAEYLAPIARDLAYERTVSLAISRRHGVPYGEAILQEQQTVLRLVDTLTSHWTKQKGDAINGDAE